MPLPPRLRVVLIVVLSGLASASCVSPRPPSQLAAITFTDRPPIKLLVQDLEVKQAYQPPRSPPNVEHLFWVAPAAPAERWARDRLVAAGSGNEAGLVVREASVVEAPLEPLEAVADGLPAEQATRYDGRLVVDLYVSVGGTVVTLTAEILHARTVAKDLTFRERERVWHEMTWTMLCQLNVTLEEGIEKRFPYMVL